MKEKIKNIIQNIMSCFKIKNIIVLESRVDYGDSSRAFSDYLVENGYNKKYKIYWFVNNKKNFTQFNYANVKFWTMWKHDTQRTFWQWLKYFWICKNAKYLIMSNRSLPKINRKSISVYVTHGATFKRANGLKLVSPDINYCLAPSDSFFAIMANEFHIDKNKLICVGMPKHDILFKKTNPQEKFKKYRKYKKVILWLPTFRKVANSQRIDSTFDFPLGLPIIYNVTELQKLNDYLKNKNMLILLKLHPAQDTTLFKVNSLSHIVILKDEELLKKGVDLCEFYKVTDALITDYSSVFYDYYQLNKPVGFTLDDFEEYKKTKGFVFAKPLDYLIGDHIYNLTDLYAFLDDVYKDKDKYKAKRAEVNKKINKYSDDKSSERLAKFLKI